MPVSMASAVDAVSIFSGIPASVKRRVTAASGIQHFGKGSLLFCEGESAHFVYGIVSGTLALFSSTTGEETIIDFFGSGELLLVPPALLNLPYMLSARATTDGVALLIPADFFRKLVESEVALAAACAKLLARHWRILVSHTKQIKTQDARSRLVRYLLDKSEISSGRNLVTLPGLKKELATHLGIAPETLSRTHYSLRKYGVEVMGQTVIVKSPKQLEKLIETIPTAQIPTNNEKHRAKQKTKTSLSYDK